MFLKYKEIISYLIVGGLTTVVSLAVYYGCVFTFLDPENPLELQAANVFESKNQNMLKEAAAFCGSRITTLLLDMACMFLMVTLLGWNDKVAKIIVQVLVTIGNYVLSKFLVFKK